MYSRIVYGKKDMPYNYSEFICDTEDDIKSLPTNNSTDKNNICSVGSKALVIETKNLYMLNNQNEWKIVCNYANSGSSVDFATSADVSDYLGI